MVKLVIVTEFPGKTDLLTGRLLSGETGRMFRELLDQAQIPMSEVEIIAASRQRPGSGKIEDFCVNKKTANELAPQFGYPTYPRNFIKSGKYLHPAKLSSIDLCIKQIKYYKPNLVMTLGAFATWALMDSAKFTPIRGTISESPIIPGLKVLPTYHPVTMMRDYSQRVIAAADVLKAKREMEFPDINRPKREVWVPENMEDVDWCRKFLNAQRRLSVDIETKNQQITCIGFAPKPSFAICFPITDSRKPNWCYWDSPTEEARVWRAIKELCESPSAKILQNGVYDIQYLWRVVNIKTMGFRDDTMIMHHCLYEELPKSLGFLGSLYTNEASWKLMRKFEEKDLK